MFTTTDDYKANQSATLRQVDFDLQWGKVDVDARDSATVASAPTLQAFSDAGQILNDRTINPTVLIGTAERNGWLLDGDCVPMPTATPADYEVGAWTGGVSGADGSCEFSFLIETDVTILSDGLTIRFYALRNEFAVDFDVVLIANGAVVQTIEVRDNDRTECIVTDAISDCDSIRLDIWRWNKGLSFFKIYQVEFGVYLEFTPDSVIRLTLTNQASAITESLPFSTCTFSFQNTDYDPMLETGDEKFVADRQPIRLRIGMPGELVENMDYILTGEPTVDIHTVTITGYSYIYLLERECPVVWVESSTLGALVEGWFALCQITDYEIDDSLYDLAYTGLIDYDTYRDAVAAVAVANCLVVDQYNETLRVRPLVLSDTDYTITADNSEFPQVSPQDVVTQVEITRLVYGLADSDELTTVDIETAGTYTVAISNAHNISVSGGTLVSSTASSVTFTASAGAEVVISGQEVEETELVETFGDTTSETKKSVEANPFIADTTAVANWILAYHAHRQHISVDWRQDNAIALLDRVTVESDFGDIPLIVESQEITFSGGGMTGTTQGRATD